MRSFEFYAPTKVIFGEGAEERVSELVKEFGGTKVLVHFGRSFAQRSGLIDRVVASLDAAGIEPVLFGGAQPNPHISLVRKGIELAKAEDVDFLLAVGGAGVIDSTKAIGYGIADSETGDVWDFYDGIRVPQACTPIGVVLTAAGAGSEASGHSVLTEGRTGKNRSIVSDLCRPRFALLNPKLTLTVPLQQTESGCVDVLMHTLGRYFSPDDRMFVTESIAEALMRNVVYNARALKRNPQNLSARAEIMWASTLSHNDVTGPCPLGDWACHQLGHELSGMFGVPNGEGLSAIWGSWARYVKAVNPHRFERIGLKVFRINYNPEDGTELAESAIEAMEGFFHEIGMPTSLRELGINPSDGQLKSLARACSRRGARTIGAFKVLGETDILTIYTAARG